MFLVWPRGFWSSSHLKANFFHIITHKWLIRSFGCYIISFSDVRPILLEKSFCLSMKIHFLLKMTYNSSMSHWWVIIITCIVEFQICDALVVKLLKSVNVTWLYRKNSFLRLLRLRKKCFSHGTCHILLIMSEVFYFRWCKIFDARKLPSGWNQCVHISKVFLALGKSRKIFLLIWLV